MAKKDYLKPQIKVITVQHEQVLVGSGGTSGTVGGFFGDTADENIDLY